jgi:glycine/serine hydroxymethyltransferase
MTNKYDEGNHGNRYYGDSQFAKGGEERAQTDWAKAFRSQLMLAPSWYVWSHNLSSEPVRRIEFP